MAIFVVESYLPRAQAGELKRVIGRLTAPSPDAEADGARYVRSFYVPEDEVCFHIFEAHTAEEVRSAGDRASLAMDRIAEAVEDVTRGRLGGLPGRERDPHL